MCRPDHYGIHYEINPWMSVAVGSDPSRALAQWTALRDLLRGLGATVELIEPTPGLPDQVFTANAGLVFGRRVVLSRFRYRVRQGESEVFGRWFEANGFEVLNLPEGRWFEGAGDALFCGETLFAGYRHRSDARSHQWVGRELGVEVLPLELVDPRFYHLDTCFCPLAEGEALYYPGAFDEYGRAVLRSRIPRLIEARGEEATAFCCNAVVVGRHVVTHIGAAHLAAELQECGYTVHALDLGEFLKSGGSAKCLTLRLEGEEAAAWRQRAQASARAV
jgi:N-dimethylarginine dimethylaminohydrolase